jgi:hypothetical protein
MTTREMKKELTNHSERNNEMLNAALIVKKIGYKWVTVFSRESGKYSKIDIEHAYSLVF